MTGADLLLFQAVWRFKIPGERQWYRNTVAERAGGLRCPEHIEAYDGILRRRREEAERPAGRDARIPEEWPTWEEAQRRPWSNQPSRRARPERPFRVLPPGVEILAPGEGAGRVRRSPLPEH